MHALATKTNAKPEAQNKHAAAPVQAAQTRQPTLADFPAGTVQRKCACGGGCPRCEDEKAVQTKLTIGPPGDRYEHEADRVADQVMAMPDRALQRHPAELDEEERVQAKPLAAEITPLAQRHPQEPVSKEASALPSSASQAIENPSGGAPLPDPVRRYMEPRFGADFSSVRLHSGSQSGRLNRSLESQAFTYGRDIWLGAGESDSNLPLLAHELTHVIQQSPSLMRAARPPPVGEPTIQRKNDYFSLRGDHKGKGAGTKTHEFLLPDIAKKNPGYFFEVRIPGGKKGATAKFQSDESAVVGRADIYKASTTIGVKFVGDDPDPEYLSASSDLRVAEGTPVPKMTNFDHAEKSAPVGKKNMPAGTALKTCSTLLSPAICRLDKAPEGIEVGDLKPSDAGERFDGSTQLNSYITGINLTASKVNSFAAANPSKIDPSTAAHWNPSPKKLGSLQIPDEYQPFSTAGKKRPVIRYQNGKPETMASESLAYVYVVPDSENHGIWMYEYVPIDRPSDVSGLKKAMEKASQSLHDPVIKDLNTKPEIAKKRKPSATVSAGPQVPIPPRPQIQRKKVDDKFKLDEWKAKFKNWQDTDAKPYLGGPEEKKTEFLDTLVQIKNRSLPSLAVPGGSEEVTAGMHQIRHWYEHGGWYGRLRSIFGGTYVKFVEFYEKARDKFRSLLPKTEGGSGLWAALVKIGVKMLKFLAHFVIGQVTERLTEAFKMAAENVIRNLFGPEIAAVEEKMVEVKAYINDFEELIKKEIFSVIDKIIEPYKAYIETIQKIMAAISEIQTWITRIKWLARIAACGAPPGVGCLWGIFGTELLEALAAEIAESCWVKREIIFPLIRSIEFVKSLPKKLVNFILDFLKDLLPGKAKELIGDINTKEPELQSDDACKELPDEEPVPPPKHIKVGWTPSPEQDVLAKLFEVYGEDTMKAIGEMLRHRGVAETEGLDLKQVQKLKAFLEHLGWSAREIRDYTKRSIPHPTGTNSLEGELKNAEQSKLVPPNILSGPPKPFKPPSDNAAPPQFPGVRVTF